MAEEWFAKVGKEFMLSDLTQLQKLTIIALRLYSNKGGESWPSLTTLCQLCSASRSGMCVVLKQLEGLEIIERVKGGKTKTTVYKINEEVLGKVVQNKNSSSADIGLPLVQNKNCKTPEVVQNKYGGSPKSELEVVQNKYGGSPKSVHEVDPINRSNRTRSIEVDIYAGGDTQKGPLDSWVEKQLNTIRKVVEAPKPVNLTELLAQWHETFGEELISREIPLAMEWLVSRKKPYTDMGRFLGNIWLPNAMKRRRENSESVRRAMTSEEELQADLEKCGLL